MSLRSRSDENKKFQEVPEKERNNNDTILYIITHKTKISIIIRFLSLVSCCTYYVPDEYWQSTEVAHRNVYGYGYLTWEWNEKIRSYLHPFIIEIYFQCVKLIGIDTSEILIYGPHVIQMILSIFADDAVYRLAWNIFRNKDVAVYSLILHWFSWFVFYTSSRTLSNTVEMCFVVISLSYFPFPYGEERISNVYSRNRLFLMILFGGIGCIIRSTSLIIWCPFIFGCLLLKYISLGDLILSTLKTLPILIILSFGIDYYFYKELVFVHYNFFMMNVFENLSVYYGTHSFHWYVTQGIPVVFTFHIIFVVVGVYYTRRTLLLFWVGIFYVLIHSCIPHKEFRFLLPVSPIFICYAGYGMQRLKMLSKEWYKRIFIITMLTNVALAGYFSLVHQRGTISVMSYLRNKDLKRYNRSVLFLMPCHSTPYYSHLHENISLNFLTCNPNTSIGYVDESEQFYTNPVHWIDMNVKYTSHKPSYIIMFNVLTEKINEKLVAMGYKKGISFFHTHFPEGRVGSYVDVYLDKDVT